MESPVRSHEGLGVRVAVTLGALQEPAGGDAVLASLVRSCRQVFSAFLGAKGLHIPVELSSLTR